MAPRASSGAEDARDGAAPHADPHDAQHPSEREHRLAIEQGALEEGASTRRASTQNGSGEDASSGLAPAGFADDPSKAVVSSHRPSEAIVSLVVVGRANTGKSTLVATLTEDRSIRISDVPGTTTEARRLVVYANGQPVLAVIDTPGFEDAVGALKVLQSLSKSVADRADAVRQFVELAEREDTFVSERRLLKPVLDGGAILYVADAAYPWRKNFEAELEILRWTGQPRAGLVNRTGEGDFSEDWRNALDQYFSIVRSISARDSSWEARLELLKDISSLRAEWRAPILGVVQQLEAQWYRRRQDTARTIASMMYAALTHTRKERVVRPDDLQADQFRLEQAFADDLRRIEEKSRHDVESIYGFRELRRRDGAAMEAPRLDHDLFSKEVWDASGLSLGQLATAGAAGGALSGLLVDGMTGGATFGGGAVIGGLIGLGGALVVGRDQFAKATIERAGLSVPDALRRRADADRTIVVGPHKGPNFPWILLVRALGHWYAVEQRTHAQEHALEVHVPVLPASAFESEVRSKLTQLFREPTRRFPPMREATVESLEKALLELYRNPFVQQQLREASLSPNDGEAVASRASVGSSDTSEL